LVGFGLESIDIIGVALRRSSAHWLGALGTLQYRNCQSKPSFCKDQENFTYIPSAISTNESLGSQLCVDLARCINHLSRVLDDHTRTLVIDTSDLLLEEELATIVGKGVNDFEGLLTMDKLVTVIRRDTRGRLASSTLSIVVDIGTITLHLENDRIERKSSEVGI
jgi:uncharacterized protein (DUF1499 family)